jgi:hypothetical protein
MIGSGTAGSETVGNSHPGPFDCRTSWDQRLGASIGLVHQRSRQIKGRCENASNVREPRPTNQGVADSAPRRIWVSFHLSPFTFHLSPFTSPLTRRHHLTARLNNGGSLRPIRGQNNHHYGNYDNRGAADGPSIQIFPSDTPTK